MGTSSGMGMFTKRKLLIILVVIAAATLLVLLLPIYYPHPDFAGRNVHRHFIWDYRHIH